MRSTPSDRARPEGRRSLRLEGWDYAQEGTYFVTVCLQGRASLFGEVVDAQMQLNDGGRMVGEVWQRLGARFPSAELGPSVVMPNHFHGLVALAGGQDGAGTRPAPTRGPPLSLAVGAPLVGAQGTSGVALGNVIGAFKSISTNEYARGVQEDGWPPFHHRLWQRNYYEHIVRDQQALDRITQYIETNPLRWHLDRENPDRQAEDDFDRWIKSSQGPVQP